MAKAKHKASLNKQVDAFFEYALEMLYLQGYSRIGIGDFLTHRNDSLDNYKAKALTHFATLIEDRSEKHWPDVSIQVARDSLDWEEPFNVHEVTPLKVRGKTFDALLLTVLMRMTWALERIRANAPRGECLWHDPRAALEVVGLTFTDKAYSKLLDVLANVPTKPGFTHDAMRGLSMIRVDKNGCVVIK